jgi:hypothetical protein
MKFLLILALAASSLQASTPAYDPEKILYSLLDLSKESETDAGLMRVKSYEPLKERLRGLDSVEISKDLYQKFVGWNQAVYRFHLEKHDETRYGTAFHIGHNLVLTNVHVLSPSYRNLTRCDGFKLKGPDRSRTYSCAAVHYCHIGYDVCLIEMNEVESTAALKLRVVKEFTPEQLEKGLYSVIGNTFGEGLKLSQAYALQVSGDRLYSNTPLHRGNSGSPLMNEEGEAIGIVHRMRLETSDNWDLGISAPTAGIVQVMREALIDNPEVLEKFNQAVLE